MVSNTSRRRGYQPLKITARLRCGVISDGLLPIDAMLYWAHHRDRLAGQARVTLPKDRLADTGPLVGKLPLQICDTHQSGQWYYAASCAVWPETVAEGVDYWTKRIDTQYLDVLEIPKARIPISSGPYRGYRMPIVYRHALTLTWYVVGHLERVQYLLSLIRHIGKKASMGWGEVATWGVEPQEEDWSVTGPEGELMRPVPHPEGVLYGIRPPYWLPINQVLCRLPTDGLSC